MADEVEQMTLEQLHGITTDPEAETKVAQALGVPAGTYNSVPEVSMTLRVAGEDAQHPGRKAAHYYGFFKGAGVKEEGSDEAMNPQPQGRASFDVSWEYRDKVDFITKKVVEGKPDNQSKLWHQACAAYRKANGLGKKDVVGIPDVLTFLGKYAVAVRFIYLEGRDEPLAVAISKAKE